MINQIIDSIRADIEALPWVERYGGLTFRIGVQRPLGNEEVSTSIVPVSRYLNTKNCEEEHDRYFFLVPDERHKSIVYFEQIGNTTFTTPTHSTGTRYRNVITGSQNLRLVVWLNLGAMGTDDPGQADHVAADLWGLVDGKKYDKLDVSPAFPAFKIKWQVNTQVQKSLAIFSGLSYEDRQDMLMYPYDFFALDVNVTWYMNKACLPAFEPGTPIDCVDVNNDVVLMESFGGIPFGTLADGGMKTLNSK